MATDPSPESTSGLFADRRSIGLMLCASVGVFAVQLDFFSVQTAVPIIADDLDSSPADLQWVVSGYMLAVASCLIVAGRLADLIGRRRVLIVGAVLFGVASALGGTTSTSELLIAMRLVQGAGAAVLFPVSLAIVTNAFPQASVQRAVGGVIALGAIAQGIGPVFGGVVTEALTWRWVFFVNIPLMVVLVLLAIRWVPDSRDESVPPSIDWLGVGVIIASIASFTYGVDRAGDWGWLSPGTAAFMGAGLIGLALFITIETRVEYPLLDLSLFRDRLFSVMTSAGSVANAGATITIFYSMVLLQDVEDFSALEAGFAFLTGAGGYTVAAFVSGRLERIRPWIVMTSALVVGGAASVVMGLVDSIVVYLVLAFFSMFGFGIGWSYTSVVTQSIVPPRLAGAASGTVLTILVGIGGVALAVATSMYTANTSTGAQNEGDVIRAIVLGTGVVALVASAAVPLLGRADRS